MNFHPGSFCYCWKGDYFPLISSRISCICSWQPPQPVPAFVASPTSSTVFNPFSRIAFSISSSAYFKAVANNFTHSLSILLIHITFHSFE